MRHSTLAGAGSLGALLFLALPAQATQQVDPLQHYSYRELYLMKTFPAEAGGMACFITIDNKAVWVRKGEYVGKRFGRVVEITARYVVISEQVEVNLGQWGPNLFKYPVGTLDSMKPDPRCAHPPR